MALQLIVGYNKVLAAPDAPAGPQAQPQAGPIGAVPGGPGGSHLSGR